MPKTALRLLPLLTLTPALAGCGGVPLPETSLPDVKLEIPLTLDTVNPLVANAHLFKEERLFPSALPSRLKDIQLTGTASLNTPASARLVADVRLVDELSNLQGPCISYSGYQLCPSLGGNLGGAQSIGKIVIEQGQTTGTVNLSGAYLTQMAHAGKGHLGLKLEQGRLEQGATLSLTNLKANAKATLF